MIDYNLYYSSVSKVFNDIRLDKQSEISMTISIIKNYLAESKGSDILDIGCGTGKYANPLCLCGHRVVGIDKSASQVAVAEQIINAILGNATSLPFESKTFDMCLCIMMVHQLTYEELKLVLCEARRVLRNDGIIIIKTCSTEDLFQRLSNNYFPSAYKINLNRYHPIPLLKELLTVSGFSVIGQVNTHINEPIRSDCWIYSVQCKHNTTLASLSDDEFQDGIRRIKIDYPLPVMLDKFHHHTYLIAKSKEVI